MQQTPTKSQTDGARRSLAAPLDLLKAVDSASAEALQCLERQPDARPWRFFFFFSRFKGF